ncbi:hypothetical protein EBU94_03745 [bacterium]|nr:hypothetical protein [bacterium]
MKKTNIPVDEKFDKQDFDLFDAISAIDKKDYGYYDRLTEEQKRKFIPFMLIHWISAVKGNSDVQGYYLLSTNHHANKYLFNEQIMKNPKLQWLMLCASSPGIGKQFHQYIPHIKDKVAKLREEAKEKDIQEYFKKIYKTDESTLKEMSELYVKNQKRKVYLANKFPHLKIDDIELLNDLITDSDVEKYERDSGN